MNTFKKNGGFTLVELIIVIAILAILSTGAIAGYSAYIQKANEAAVKAVLSDISTSAVLANAKAGGISGITVATSTATGKLDVVVTVDSNAVDGDFEDLFTASLAALNASDNVPETPDNVKTYVCTIDAPSAWTSSDFATAGATWTPANGWN